MVSEEGAVWMTQRNTKTFIVLPEGSYPTLSKTKEARWHCIVHGMGICIYNIYIYIAFCLLFASKTRAASSEEEL